LKYIDRERQTDLEGWGEGLTARKVRMTRKRKQQDYGSIAGADEEWGANWKILGTQAHDLTWDWTQESS
jgi:hypothetical protein